MKRLLYIPLCAVAAFVLAVCCTDDWPELDWDTIPESAETDLDAMAKPDSADNIIVAHRGGASECGYPDNSLASLSYSMSLGCYASECDIYWTADDNVVIAHADSYCQINGLYPWETTLAEIRAAGTLSNGEQVPCLEDFLEVVMQSGSCTKLWLDIKNITYPSTLTQYPINAVRRACEIIEEMEAYNYVEFICTGNTTVMAAANVYATAAGINIGWMGNQPASTYVSYGYTWANLNAHSYMSSASGGTGSRTLKEFEAAGVELSVFNVDKQAGDSNAVYSDEAIDYYVTNSLRFKALCTNYPSWLIALLEARNKNKTWDGIRSYNDWSDFLIQLSTDPTASRFVNSDGEVVLYVDITESGTWTPISSFTGVFNGNGHTITLNYKSDETDLGLFAQLGGTVKNLTVAGSVVSTCEDGIVYVGGIAGSVLNGAVLQDCTNQATITMNKSETSAAQYVGGIFGRSYDGATISGCTNEGAIDIYITSPAKGNYIGGISGYTYVGLTDCTNSASIVYADSVSSGNGNYLGGISGRLVRSSGFTLENCHNTGNLTFKSMQEANNFFGGILGDGEAENLTDETKTGNKLLNCTNSGTITSTMREEDSNARMRMGGLCGSFINLEGCTNGGLVTVTQGTTAEYAVGGLCGIGGTGTWKNSKSLGCVVNKLGYTYTNNKAHTGGLAGWVLGTLTVTNCAVDGAISSCVLYNYDDDKGTTSDLTHKNTSCAGMFIGRVGAFTCTITDSKVYGSVTRTVNSNGDTETTDFTSSVTEEYLYGTVASGGTFTSSGITCESSK